MVQLSDRLAPVLGDKAAKALDKAFGFSTVGDLLLHAPRRYATRGSLTDLGHLEVGSDVTVEARIETVKSRPMKARRGTLTDVVVADDSGHRLHLTFFNQTWRSGQLEPGRSGIFSGKVSRFNKLVQLAHPEVTLFPESHDEPDPEAAALFANELIPVYPATAKFSSVKLAKLVRYVLTVLDPQPDLVPPDVLERQGLIPFERAIRQLHLPQTADEHVAATRRLAFEEAFLLLGVMARRRLDAAARPATARIPTGGLRARFDARLPFELTAGQREIGQTISQELARPHPMHRLLQGEVGSGKTVVALRAMLDVVDAGGQCVLLAPTEVLAQQHYRTLRAMLGPLGARGELDGDPEGTEIVLLTGSSTSAQRKAALLAMASGAAGIVVGTHALLEDRVQFADLGLIVIDEQHRFGVEQRATLGAKARDGVVPHVLVMTATPIPRTAAITVFGDLDVSSLTELPQGRQPIASHVVVAMDKPHFEARMWERVREEVAKGHQVYVVCPRISASDPDDSGVVHAAAEAVYERLRDEELHDLRLGLLHGRMSSDAKDDVMRRFATHGSDGIDVLVATTVIEVGVDVPNASTMVILDADRFGISQLHQLRGRVGRGSVPGLCLLHTQQPGNAPSVRRLEAVASTSDGFRLAQLDLEQRGEGDVLGVSQSGGRSSLRLLSVLAHMNIIINAKEEIDRVVADDPGFERHPALARAIDARELELRTQYLDKA
jgi:ATP-dependent DNA helicase RecG